MAASPAKTFTPLGPGTLTIGSTPFDFSCEVKGASVTHSYEQEDPETMLCGTKTAGAAVRTDGLTFETYADLGAQGLYKYVYDHDLEEVEFSFTPNTDNGAKWDGKVQLKLPESIGAEEYGANVEAPYEWTGTELFTFTPTPDAPSN